MEDNNSKRDLFWETVLVGSLLSILFIATSCRFHLAIG